MRIMQTPETLEPVAWAKIVSFEPSADGVDEVDAKLRVDADWYTRKGEVAEDLLHREGGTRS